MTKQATKRKIDELRAKIKAAALTATVVLGMQAAKAQPASPEQDPKQDNKEMVAPAPKNDIEVTSEENLGIRAAAAAAAMGLNTMEMFDLKNVEWNAEMASGISGSETSDRIAAKAATNRTNKDERHCLAGVKSILRSSGINIDNCGKHAYMAAAYLRNMPDKFTEIKCDYSVLPYLPEGTVVVQYHGKGKDAPSGHIFVISEERGKKVQRCGQSIQWSLPENDSRGRSGQHYGKMSVFVPTSCMIDERTCYILYEKGCLNPDVAEILAPRIAKLDKIDNELSDNLHDTLQVTPQMIRTRLSNHQ